jgi:type II secretory pathway pseudopilin PulG
MPAERGEAGFGLLELVVCTGVLVLGSVLALAALPTLARGSQAGVLRGAALDVARNAIERARAAAAYAPPARVAAPAARAATLATHAWAFVPAATSAAAVHVEAGWCGASATDVALAVTTGYDAPTDTLTVSVAYPADPCAPGTFASVTLAAQLAPAAYAPQTELDAPVADPAVQ